MLYPLTHKKKVTSQVSTKGNDREKVLNTITPIEIDQDMVVG